MKKKLLAGQIDAPQASEATNGVAPATLDRPVRCVYEGTFNSIDGEVTLTAAQIDAFAANHNSKIDKLGRELQLGDCPPLQLDHSESARDTVGRLWGKLEARTADVPGVGLARCLFGVARFIGPENTAPAADGRWSRVSVGIDFETMEIDELSVVPFPAAERAALLSKGRFSMKPEHLKHFLVSCKQMSEDDALKHMGGLDDAGREKLEGEYKEHLKKLGVDPVSTEQGKEGGPEAGKGPAGEQGMGGEGAEEHLGDGDHDDDKDEEKKKMRAARMSKIREAKEKLAAAHVKLREGAVKSRLAQLRADARITPAEQKNLGEKRFGAAKDKFLHELAPEAIEAVFVGFESREPVITTRRLGSTHGVDLSSMGEAMKKQRLAQMEQETLSNMPFTRGALAATRKNEGAAHAQLSGQPAGDEGGKVVRLSVADSVQGSPIEEETDAARVAADEAVKSHQTLSAQIVELTSLVASLETTV